MAGYFGQRDPGEPRPLVERLVLGAVAASMMVLIGFVYEMSWHDGRWPVGHPWSGLTLLTMAVALGLRLGKRDPPRAVSLALTLLACVFAVLWLLRM